MTLLWIYINNFAHYSPFPALHNPLFWKPSPKAHLGPFPIPLLQFANPPHPIST